MKRDRGLEEAAEKILRGEGLMEAPNDKTKWFVIWAKDNSFKVETDIVGWFDYYSSEDERSAEVYFDAMAPKEMKNPPQGREVMVIKQRDANWLKLAKANSQEELKTAKLRSQWLKKSIGKREL